MSVKAIRADLNGKSLQKYNRIKDDTGLESDAEFVRFMISEIYKIKFPEDKNENIVVGTSQ